MLKSKLAKESVMTKSFLFAGCLLCTAVANGAATVGFNPPTTFVAPTVVNLGDTFSLGLEGKSFASGLDGGGLNLAFNPSILHVTGVSINPLWEFLPSPGSIDNVAGQVSHIQFNSFASTPTGDFAIGKVTFSTIGLGMTQLTLSEDLDNPFASGGMHLPATLNPGFVQAVPEISASWMLLIGLGLMGFARKMKWV